MSTDEITLDVDEMSCGGCVNAVSKTIARSIDADVDDIDVDLDAGRARFRAAPKKVDDVVQALQEAGFPARQNSA